MYLTLGSLGKKLINRLAVVTTESLERPLTILLYLSAGNHRSATAVFTEERNSGTQITDC